MENALRKRSNSNRPKASPRDCSSSYIKRFVRMEWPPVSFTRPLRKDDEVVWRPASFVIAQRLGFC